MQHLLFLCKKIKLQNPAGFNVCSERFGAKHSYETEPSSKFPSGVNLSTTTALHLSTTTPLLGEFPKLSRSLKRMIWKWQLFQKLLMGKHVRESWVNFLFTDRVFNWKSSKGCARSGFQLYHRIQTRPKTPSSINEHRKQQTGKCETCKACCLWKYQENHFWHPLNLLYMKYIKLCPYTKVQHW